MGCIYIVTNKVNNKQYVGQTIHTGAKRFYGHCRDDNILGRAIRKYEKDQFIIKEYIDIRDDWMDWAEQEIISHCNSIVPYGYNLHLGGQGNRLVSDATKEKISKSKKGQVSPNKGKKISKEQIEKIRLKHLGHKWTAEQKENLSKIRKAHPEKYAHRKGKKMSEETRKKMSESAKKVAHTPEWNKHVSEAQKGKIVSDSTRKKISIFMTGRSCPESKRIKLTGIKQTEERKTAQKIRMKQWWAERKGGTQNF